jgi:hypothetical protein
LFNGDAFGGWPKDVAAKSVVPGGGNIVVGLLPSAIRAVVVGADWMKAVGVAICSHVVGFFIWGRQVLLSPVASPAFGSLFSLFVNFVAMAAMMAVSFLISAFTVDNFSFVCTLAAASVAETALTLTS